MLLYNQNDIFYSTAFLTQVLERYILYSGLGLSLILGLLFKHGGLPCGESGGARALAGLADGPCKFIGPACI